MGSVDFVDAVARGCRDFRGADLRGLELRATAPVDRKNKLDLKGFDFSGANLERAVLQNCSFRGANLTDVRLVGSKLSLVDFSDATLVDAKFSERGAESSMIGGDFSRANLRGAQLGHIYVYDSPFNDAVLDRASLDYALCWGNTFIRAEMRGTSLNSAHLEFTNFTEANLHQANLKRANLKRAILVDAEITSADLSGVNLYSADITRTNFAASYFRRTVMANVDLTAAFLGGATHGGPSAVSQDTLERTAAGLATHPAKRGEVVTFLKGCGLEQHLIEYFGSMIGRPLEFYGAFISYSHADKSFAMHLHDSLQARGVRCWLDEHDIRVGDRILDVIDEAIRISDKVLLCCSMTSLESWWVKDEMRKALERERRERRSLIIPIMLDHYLIDGWRDGMGAEIRSRLAADMTGWDSNHAIFERGLERIVMALRASA